MLDLTAYQILDRIYYLLFAFILIPIGIGIYRRSDFAKTDRYIFGLLVSLLILEIFSETLRWNRLRNHFVNFPITFSVLYFSILYFYYPKIQIFRHKLILVLGLSGLIFLEVFYTGQNQINSLTKSLSFIIILILSIINLKKIFINKLVFEFSDNPNFWYSIAFANWSFFSFLPSLFERYFIETSLNLYYFFDTLKLFGFAISCIIFALGFRNISKIKM